MVQVLPYVPTFGQQFAPVLAESIGQVSKVYEQKRARTALEKMFAPQQPSQAGQTPTQIPQGEMQNPNPQVSQHGGQSPLQHLLSKPGGPSPAEILPVIDLVTKGYGKEGAKLVSDQINNQIKLAGKEAIDIRAEERGRQAKTLEKRAEDVHGKREIINSSRRNLKSAREAVQSGDVGAFSVNSFADLFGAAGERFKTAKGAQLDTVTKHLLFDTLKNVTAKGTNLWLEKVALSASPKIGKSEAANETLITLALGDLDIKEKKLDLEEDLLGKYEQLGLKPPIDFEKSVNDLLKPYAEKVEEQMAYDTRVIYEKEKGSRYLNNLERVPKGTPLTIEKRDALIKKAMGNSDKPISEATPEQKSKAKNWALKLGYSIPKFDPTNSNQELEDGE